MTSDQDPERASREHSQDEGNIGLSAKQPVEALNIRVRPRPVVRFKRRAIVGLCAVSSLALVTVGWMALKPVTFTAVATGDDREIDGKSSKDALSKAPASYTDVPKLGPPLPGDLGPAIMAHQQATSSIAPVPGIPIHSGDQTALEEAQRLSAERLAARQAGVLIPLTAAKSLAADSERKSPDEGRAMPAPEVAMTSSESSVVNQHAYVPATSAHVISAGSVIAANLITGINSDMPGLATAQISQAVYDSPTGRTLLIPQGARLIGRYDDKIGYGQRRTAVTWQRIIFPDGASIQIEDVPAADSAGHAGLADTVDRHGWEVLKGAILSSVLGVGSELGLQGEGTLVRALRQSMQQNMSSAGDKIVGKALDIAPTITVRPGWPVRVLVQRDLVLPPWQGQNRK